MNIHPFDSKQNLKNIFQSKWAWQNESIHKKVISPFLDGPKKQLFKVYHLLFQKNYDLNSEEGVKRYKIFKSNLKLHKEHNDKNLGYTLGIGPFTDLTQEELINLMIDEERKVEESKFKEALSTKDKLKSKS